MGGPFDVNRGSFGLGLFNQYRYGCHLASLKIRRGGGVGIIWNTIVFPIECLSFAQFTSWKLHIARNLIEQNVQSKGQSILAMFAPHWI